VFSGRFPGQLEIGIYLKIFIFQLLKSNKQTIFKEYKNFQGIQELSRNFQETVLGK
jgi:hypothetical protein